MPESSTPRDETGFSTIATAELVGSICCTFSYFGHQQPLQPDALSIFPELLNVGIGVVGLGLAIDGLRRIFAQRNQ